MRQGTSLPIPALPGPPFPDLMSGHLPVMESKANHIPVMDCKANHLKLKLFCCVIDNESKRIDGLLGGDKAGNVHF